MMSNNYLKTRKEIKLDGKEISDEKKTASC
jgi:hypothetical protein